MKTNALHLCYVLAFAHVAFAQTTVTLNDGDNNATPYDTTGNDTTFTIASGSATQSGIVSGSGSVIKTGAGTVEFTGANDLSGAIDVQEGTLSYASPANLFMVTSGISVGDSATATLTVPVGGYLSSFGNLTLGNTSAGHGTLSLDGNPSLSWSMFLSGDLIVGNAGSGTMNVTAGAFPVINGATRLGAGVGGNGTLLVDDDGNVSISQGLVVGDAANSFGSVTVSNSGFLFAGYVELGAGAGSQGHLTLESGGVLALRDDAGDALRAGAGTASVSIDGGILRAADGGTFTTSVPLAISNHATFQADRIMTINGVISGSGTLIKTGGDPLFLTAENTYTGGTTVTAGTLTLGGGGTTGSVVGDITNNGWVTFARVDDYTFQGVISGTGSLAQEGHILRLSSAQTYTGATEVRTGYLVLPTNIDQALAATTTMHIRNGGTLDISNRNLTVAGLTGGGQIYSFGGSAGELTVNTAAGPSQEYYGSLGGSFANFSLVKTGAGILELSGTNTYTGTTTVNEGTLLINGSIAGGAITVNTDGTLGGSGTIGGAVTLAGTLAPGESPGTLNFLNDLTLESTATLTMEISGTGSGEFDILNGNGTNALALDGILALDNTGYTATLGDTLTVFTNWDTITGSFSSITGTDLGGGLEWDTSGLATTGAITVIPEPSTFALLALFLGAATLRLRRGRNG